jgi:hypothetical protein
MNIKLRNKLLTVLQGIVQKWNYSKEYVIRISGGSHSCIAIFWPGEVNVELERKLGPTIFIVHNTKRKRPSLSSLPLSTCTPLRVTKYRPKVWKIWGDENKPKMVTTLMYSLAAVEQPNFDSKFVSFANILWKFHEDKLSPFVLLNLTFKGATSDYSGVWIR